MYPTAQEEDPLYANVNVYIKENKIYKMTDKKCICPRVEAESNGFSGLVQSNKHQNAMKILTFQKDTFSTTKFFCIRCLKVRSSQGGNISRHYIRKMHSCYTACSK